MKKFALTLVFVLLTAVTLCGCDTFCGSGSDDEEVIAPDLAAFEAAGPITPKIDRSKLTLALKPAGAYRLVKGDVLELDMPRVMAVIAQDVQQPETRYGKHLSRVDSKGQIIVPMIGRVDVVGKTLQEVEEHLLELYYPQYLKFPPSIVGTVTTNHTEPVTILGAVKTSGTFQLRPDEMSLVTLLSKAGGIEDQGAKAIRIKRSSETGKQTEKLVMLPVEGLDIDFVDVAMQAGDVVEVERLSPQRVSVIGLVNHAGVFDYPLQNRYTLLEAIALGGGLNLIADPRYATVYRLNREGELVSAKFRITGGGKIAKGASIVLKPGDVVAVEQTLETNLRLIMAQIVRVGFGIGGNVVFY